MPLFDDIISMEEEPTEGIFSDIVAPREPRPMMRIPTGVPTSPTITAQEPDRDFWGEFGASLERGTANVVGGIAGSVARLATLADKPGLNWIGKQAGRIAETAQWAELDPENLPSPTDDAKTFVAQALGGTIPFMTGTVAATLVAGPLAGAAIAFSVEGENAFRDAIATGATESEADKERVIVGGLNALIEMVQVRKILKSGQGVKTLVHSARNKVWQKVAETGKRVGVQMLKDGLQEGLEEALQGTVSEVIPLWLRGQKPQGNLVDFLIRRGLEFTGGALAGTLLAGAGGAVGGVAQKIQQTQVDDLNAGGEVAPEGVTPAKKFRVIETKADGTETVSEINPEAFPEYREGFESQEDAQAMADTLSQSMAKDPGTTYRVETVEAIAKDVEVENVTDKFTRVLGETQKLTDEQLEIANKARSQERAKRINEAREIIESGPEEELFYKGLAKLKGKLPETPTFTPLEQLGDFKPAEINELRVAIRTNPNLRGFDRTNTETAFNKLFKKGELPIPSEIALLEKQFGSEFAEAVRKLRSKGQKAWDMTMDVINAPRTLLASVDVSGPGRQGILLAARHPVLWSKSLGASYKIFFGKESLEAAEQIDADTRTGKYSDLATQSGLDLTEWEGIGRTLEKHEEFFMSKVAEKVPLVKRSERAYVVALNKLRMDTFAQTAEQWEGTGKTTKDYKDLAKVINHLTGRGDLKSLKKLAPILNGLFFSPKFVASRIQVPIDIFTTTPAVRKMLLGNLVSFVGTGLGILGLLSLVKGVKIEKDPRSSDFGKVRIGNVRIDFWAGYTPVARLIAQLMTGERKATDTGKIYDVDAGEVIARFIQSKFSPPASLAMDLYKGQDFLGQDLSWDASEVAEQFYKRLTPLAIQDTIDAIYYQGLSGGAMAAPLAFHGIGVQAYPKTLSKELDLYRNEISNKFFGQRWDDIGPEAQKLLADEHPQLNSMQARITAERSNFDFIGKQLEEQKAAGLEVQETLPREVQNQMEANGVSVGGLGRRVSSNWFLNDNRYKMYQDTTGIMLKRVLPRIVSHSNWNTLDETKKRELLNYVIGEAKKLAREQIVQNANRGDLISAKEFYGR